MRWSLIIPVALAVVAVAVVAVLVLGGGESKAERASAKVCDARADIAKHVDTLDGMTLATADIDQVKSSLQEIRRDLSTIAEARGDLSEARRSQVQDANEEFAGSVRQTLGGVTSLASLTAAKPELRSSFDQLAASYRQTYGRLDCSS
jgi:rRNA maturation endonuclease Nob1